MYVPDFSNRVQADDFCCTHSYLVDRPTIVSIDIFAHLYITVMMKVLSRLEILLVVLGHLELQACSCSSDNITFLSYFPCTDLPDGNATSFIENCDFLTYVASKLAVEEINDKDNVLNGSFVNLVSFATGKVSCIT